jgi:hypothetical protein
MQRVDFCRAHCAFTKVSKQPLANAKPPEKGALIYRYQKLDSPTAKAHFKGALIYKVANRTSQNAALHHVNKCPLAMLHSSRPRKAVKGSAKKSLFYKMQVDETQKIGCRVLNCWAFTGWILPARPRRHQKIGICCAIDQICYYASSLGLAC